MILHPSTDRMIFEVIHPPQQRPTPTIVCDGWIEPRHARKVLSEGSEAVSHGMCIECSEALR